MIKFLFLFSSRLFLLLSIIHPGFSMGQDILWEKSIGGIHSDLLFDCQPTPDFGFILAGASMSGKSGNKLEINKGNLDYLLIKISEKGEFEWQKSFGGTGSDLLHSVKLTTDGGFILAGTSNSPVSDIKKDSCRGGDDLWIIKLDARGGEQWQRTIGGIGQEKVSNICQTPDGGYIIGASSDSYKSSEKKSDTFGSMDYWIIKITKEGFIEWEKNFGGEGYDELRSITIAKDRGFILGGVSNSLSGGNKNEDRFGAGDFWVLKLSSKGDIEWQKVLGGVGDDQLQVICQTKDGGIIAGGNSNSEASFNKQKSNGVGTDFWVIKLKEDGEVIWDQTYDVGHSDILSSLVENNDGTLLLGGFAQGENTNGKDKKGINDFIAIKISSTGEFLWETSVGSDGEDILKKAIITRDGSYVLAGTSSPNAQAKHKHVQKLKSNKSNNNSTSIKNFNETTSETNEYILNGKEDFKKSYNEKVEKANNFAKKQTGRNGDSPVEFGINSPQSSGAIDKIRNGESLETLLPLSNNPKLPASADKKDNFGNYDFWIVKLKDKTKTNYDQERTLEAFPNPTSEFSNVIVNYEFQTGTATVVDIAGRVLEQFEINTRTIPVNLSGYPEGIYIVNIKTESHSEGIRIIKEN